MRNTVSDIVLLLQPCMRSIAYLRVFESLGIAPGGAILLEGNIGNSQELKSENARFGYDSGFFNPAPDILATLDCLCPVTPIASMDVNCAQVREALLHTPGRYVIFSASGILGQEIFATGKKFIHVHPGALPQYRGSTCFYYSLLETGLLGSTAFFMDAQIDTGAIIAASKFSINYALRPGQQLFMDYILDPFIRAVTLQKVLAAYLAQGEITGCPQPPGERTPCYVMHPLLRRLATAVLTSRYDDSKPVGIFDLEEERVQK